MRITNKKIAGVALGAIVLTGTGVAFAYWTSEGTGTGSATIGDTQRNVVVTGTSNNTPAALDPETGLVTTPATNQLYPGGPAATVALKVDNPNSYSVQLNNQTLTLTKVTCGADVADRKSWFSILPATALTVAPGTTSVPGSANANNVIKSATVVAPHSQGTDLVTTDGQKPIAVAMLDSSADQNVCKDVDINYEFLVN